MDSHRKVAATSREEFELQPPFSFFDLIEDKYGSVPSIRRLFSLARSSEATSLIVEEIPAVGIIAEEDEDIAQLASGAVFVKNQRLSFWKSTPQGKLLVGYAIVKLDYIPGRPFNWHVFEAVFTKYDHPHNCIAHPKVYRLCVDGADISIEGILYCQQNVFTKACAQVAMRSLLSRLLPDADISYRRINEIAKSIDPQFTPSGGLGPAHIRAILQEFGIRFHDIDYEEAPEARETFPYQKYAYAGLESGGGCLLGFRWVGPGLTEDSKHIIPIYGHTFNKDTWVPDAEASYFHVGEDLRYMPSESWTSSFLGHDDNFGPNFCIPRLYLGKQIEYIVEIFRPGIMYSGINAEAIAVDILYSLKSMICDLENRWIQRLHQWIADQKVVLRSQALTREEYLDHLLSINDWEGHSENAELGGVLGEDLPNFLWVIEISTPQLFPANERKLGEIVLDGTKELIPDEELSAYDVFEFARLPGVYLLGGPLHDGVPEISSIESDLIAHTPLLRV